MNLNTPTVDTVGLTTQYPEMVGGITTLEGPSDLYWQVCHDLGLYRQVQAGLPGGVAHEAGFTGNQFYGLDLFSRPQAAQLNGQLIQTALENHGLSASVTQLAIVQRLEQTGRADKLNDLVSAGKLNTLTLVYITFMGTSEGVVAVSENVGRRLPACVLDNTIGLALDQNMQPVLGQYHLVDLVTDLGEYSSFMSEVGPVIRDHLRLTSRTDVPLYNVFLANVR